MGNEKVLTIASGSDCKPISKHSSPYKGLNKSGFMSISAFPFRPKGTVLGEAHLPISHLHFEGSRYKFKSTVNDK